jgi:hypothetical protein
LAEITLAAMAGLDPAIQSKRRARQMALDPRIKSGGDETGLILPMRELR